MLADRATAQRRRRAGRGPRLGRLDVDQREVAGAAAHVADQHPAHAVQRLGQAIAVAPDPVAEGRLRLLQQQRLGQAGLARGLQRQRTRRLVEGGRQRQHQALALQRRVRVMAVPGGTHLRQIAGAGGDRRDTRHAVVGAPRQDGCQPVGLRMRQPALGAGHQPARHLAAALARQHADQRRRLGGVACGALAPGQGALGQLARRRVVAHAGQQRRPAQLARRDPLVDAEERDRAGLAAALAARPQRRAGDDGVRRAQVDADDEGRRHRLSPRSAGRACRTRPSSARCRPPAPRPAPACRPRSPRHAA